MKLKLFSDLNSVETGLEMLDIRKLSDEEVLHYYQQTGHLFQWIWDEPNLRFTILFEDEPKERGIAYLLEYSIELEFRIKAQHNFHTIRFIKGGFGWVFLEYYGTRDFEDYYSFRTEQAVPAEVEIRYKSIRLIHHRQNHPNLQRFSPDIGIQLLSDHEQIIQPQSIPHERENLKKAIGLLHEIQKKWYKWCPVNFSIDLGKELTINT